MSNWYKGVQVDTFIDFNPDGNLFKSAYFENFSKREVYFFMKSKKLEK